MGIWDVVRPSGGDSFSAGRAGKFIIPKEPLMRPIILGEKRNQRMRVVRPGETEKYMLKVRSAYAKLTT